MVPTFVMAMGMSVLNVVMRRRGAPVWVRMVVVIAISLFGGHIMARVERGFFFPVAAMAHRR